MASTKKTPLSLIGLQQSMDPFGANRQLMDQYDAERQAGRQAEDEAPVNAGLVDPAQANYFKTFNRGQEDAATGPGGFDRQWVPLLQSLKGKRFAGAPGLDTETYADPDANGVLQNRTPNKMRLIKPWSLG
jgi:hypothetical protein